MDTKRKKYSASIDGHRIASYVEIDQRYYRPAEVDTLCGDASKVKEILGWEPKVSFEELTAMMIDADWELAGKERLIVENGSHWKS